MTCKGTCETRRYRFSFDDKTQIETSAGAKPLTPEEYTKIFNDYFDAIREKACKTCADGCECVPQDPILTRSTDHIIVDLPEPIVATSGSDTYTVKGAVRLGAEFIRGACTPQFDKSVQKKPEPEEGRDFTLKTKFKPKAGTADCNCRCERQVYSFIPTAATTIDAKGKAPPFTKDKKKRDPWLKERLRDAYEKAYPDEELEECKAGCTCLLENVTTVLAEPRVVKIDPPITAFVIVDVSKSDKYEISGEFEVRAYIYKGVCVPKKLVLDTG